MPKPRSRALHQGPAEEAEAEAAPLSAAAVPAHNEPRSPVPWDGGGSHSDGEALLRNKGQPWANGMSDSTQSGGDGGGGCWLAAGASSEARAEKKRVQRKLLLALALALLFMLVEVVGGIWAGSLAIITDAAHLLSDSSGFAVAALAAHWAARAAPPHLTFGYHRVEVLGALASLLAVWVVTANLLVEAIHRMVHPQPVNGKVMFCVALAGVACNLLMMMVLGHNHHHGLGGSCSHGSGQGGCCPTESGDGPSDEAQGGIRALWRTGAGCVRGDGCCVGDGQPRLAGLGGLVDVEMGGAKRQVAAEAGEEPSMHSGLLSVLQAAGAGQPTQLGSSSGGGWESGGAEQWQGKDGAASNLGAAPGGGHATVPILASAAGPEAALQSEGSGQDAGRVRQRENINLRGAVIHVIGDLVQSIGVCIAGALVWWHQDSPRWALADPVCTFLFAGLVLCTTAGLSRDICDVLMERVPRGMDVGQLRSGMEQSPGVASVADLHVWSLSPGTLVLSARVHLAKGAGVGATLRLLEAYCHSRGFEHCTLQPELHS